MTCYEANNITDLVFEESSVRNPVTPGLEHIWLLRLLDRSGLSHWLLGLGAFLTLTITAVVFLIISRYPNPDIYRNSVAFCAISSFFLVFYIGMGRGWHHDLIQYIEFDRTLESVISVIRPSKKAVYLELVIAAICASINLQIANAVQFQAMPMLFGSITLFYFIQWMLIVFCVDIIFRQLICLMRIVKIIRIDLLNADFYSQLANPMVRHVGLYIFGLCIISLSYIVFTEGTLTTGEMFVAMMPWYLPGLIIISLYIVPYNHFRKRVGVHKQQELNAVNAALSGNVRALDNSLLKDEAIPSKIDLLFYQDKIARIKEWPFTDRIRALVLFGILPPLTWVLAAFIEIIIESSL